MKVNRTGTTRYFIALLLSALLIMTTAFAGCGKSPSQNSGSVESVYSESAESTWNLASETESAENSAIENVESGNAVSPNSNLASEKTSALTSAKSEMSSGNDGKPNADGLYTDTFYVDSKAGNDDNDGLSPKSPFQSLSAVPSYDLGPGAKILLKCGSIFEEHLTIVAHGTANKPVIVSSYGTGAKPVINCSDKEVVLIHNSQYIEISNLEITNIGNGNMEQRRGIYITTGGLNMTSPVLSHIYLKNLNIHNIKSNANRESAGIFVQNREAGVNNKFNDLRIEDCTISDISGCGIIISSMFGKREGVKWDLQPKPYLPCTNVVIRNNVLHDIESDGMWISTTDGCIMENNLLYNNCFNESFPTAGMWPHNSDNAVMQYNEVYHTKLAGGDGQGLDVDINCNNTLVQYNYSHDNEGGFLLVCTDSDGHWNRKTTVRYNISQNDLNSLIAIKGEEVTGLKVYNNTFYTEKGYSNGTINCLLWTNKNDTTFTNNIFVNDNTLASGSYGKFVDNKDGQGISTSNAVVNMTFENNIFFGKSPAKSPHAEGGIKLASGNKIGVDPMLSAPGTGAGKNKVQGYQLTSSSPCLKAGKTISNNGEKDYLGKKLPVGTPDIGACQYH